MRKELVRSNRQATDTLPSDLDLMAQISLGDTNAFHALYDRFSAPLYSLALRILQSRCEAEDVVQEGFVTAWQRAFHFRAELGSPFVWIATIIRHKAIDRLRANLRHVDRLRTSFEDRHDPDGPDTALGALTSIENGTIVQKALRELRQVEHRLITLSFFDGLTHLEIADGLGLPVGTVKARIRRGLNKLRAALARLPG